MDQSSKRYGGQSPFKSLAAGCISDARGCPEAGCREAGWLPEWEPGRGCLELGGLLQALEFNQESLAALTQAERLAREISSENRWSAQADASEVESLAAFWSAQAP